MGVKIKLSLNDRRWVVVDDLRMPVLLDKYISNELFEERADKDGGVRLTVEVERDPRN